MGIDVAPQSCQVAGHKMVYYRAGHGETVFLVHGITTYSFIWRNLFAELAAKYDVIAVDLLGCGISDMPLDVSYAVKDHAERLGEFISALGIDKFHFVGHDLGGGMGQIFAIKHPELLFDLSLINSVAYDFWPVQPITAMRTPIVRQFLMASLDLGTFRLIVKRGIYHKENVTDELMDLFMQPLQTSTGRKAFLHFARCLDNHNLLEIADDLRQLRLPVLIIRADDDPYLSAAISIKLHAEIPASRLVKIPHSGHFIQEDVPERLVAELFSFFGVKDD